MERIKAFMADDGYEPIPILGDEWHDAVVVPFGELSANEYSWRSGNAYLKKEDNATVSWHNTETGQGMYGTGAVSNLAVVAYRYGPNSEYFAVAWYMANGGDTTTILEKAANDSFASNFYLYRGLYEDASSYIIEIDLTEWDDTPSTDPENDPLNMLPQGGEYADLQNFDLTDLISLSEIEEPETLDYGTMITAYQLEASELRAIGDALFITDFWTTLKNKFTGLSDPLSMILSAVELPFSLGVVPSYFAIGGEYVEDTNGQYIGCSKHTGRYKLFDFGSVHIKEVWGTARDYSDTSMDIFLPFVGMKTIDPEICIGSTLQLKANVDVWTGDILYMLHVTNNLYYNAQYVPYRWAGNVATKIPLGRVDSTTPILSAATSIGSIAAGLAVGGPFGAAAGFVSGAKGLSDIANKGFSPLAQSSGGTAGAVGAMDLLYPYIIVKRSIPQYPVDWRKHMGAPRFQTLNLDTISGFTRFANIQLVNMVGASKEEIDTLKTQLITEGIIL